VLNFCRELTSLRRSGRAGQLAPLERVLLDDQVWAFRVGGSTTVANLSPEPARSDLGPAVFTVLASTEPGAKGNRVSGEFALAPWEAMVLAG
jgi:hypothetical protein